MFKKLLQKKQPESDNKKKSKDLNQLNDLGSESSSGQKKKSKKNDVSESSTGNEHVSESSSGDVSKAILAFRTITTILSLIQSGRPTTVSASDSGTEQINKNTRHELRVLDALSAVIVRRYEIAAVMTKRYDGSKIEVLISVNDTSEPVLTFPQQNQHSGKLPGWLQRFIVTPNPRDPDKNKDNLKTDSLTTRNTTPRLADPNIGISEALSMADRGNLLKTFLQTEW